MCCTGSQLPGSAGPSVSVVVVVVRVLVYLSAAVNPIDPTFLAVRSVGVCSTTMPVPPSQWKARPCLAWPELRSGHVCRRLKLHSCDRTCALLNCTSIVGYEAEYKTCDTDTHGPHVPHCQREWHPGWYVPNYKQCGVVPGFDLTKTNTTTGAVITC